jgi:hypothetical protein
MRRWGALAAASLFAAGCAPEAVGLVHEEPTERSWEVRTGVIDLDAVETDPSGVSLELFDEWIDVAWVALTEKDGASSWWGRVPGEPGSEVALTRSGDAWAGTVRVSDRLFQLAPSADGVRLAEIDEDRLPPDLEPVRPPSYRLAPAASDLPGRRSSRIDVAVAYTPAALAAAGSTAAIEATIALAETETNAGFAATGVNASVNVVGVAAATGVERPTEWNDMLDKLRGDGDGFADEVHALRAATGADTVVLLVEETSACGIAFVMTEPGAAFADHAFALVNRSCATGYYSFGHELGHNLGSAHHPEFGEAAAAAWAYGHRDADAGFRTVMAYNCTGGCPRVNHWSDPTATYNGAPMGDAALGDNRRNLDATRSIVAAFRAPLVATVNPPTVVAPASDTLPGGAATFGWTDVGATAYRVVVGASRGAADYADTTTTSTSLEVGGLPLDGSAVWVEVTATLGASTATAARAYTAAHAETPDFLDPEPGDEVGRTDVTFHWSDPGLFRYRLRLGTTAGAGDLLDVVTSSSRATAASLPAGPVFGELAWEDDDGAWHTVRGTFTAK